MTATVYALPMAGSAPVVQACKNIPRGFGVTKLATRRAAKARNQAAIKSLKRMRDEANAVLVRLGDDIMALGG